MQEVEYISHMGSDTQIAMAARISFANEREARSLDDNTKLLNYLAKHKHWSPFAHTAITLRMRAPLPIRTQCMKHAVGFVINEESRRYISSEPTFFLPDWRGVVKNKKQGSGDTLGTSKWFEADVLYTKSIAIAKENYLKLLELGVCEEQARFTLPQGTEVNWYWTGSLAAFARFCHQRLDSHAQVEIQELAKEVSNIIKPLFPVAWAALVEGE